jgi:aryl-alcohol dehydrogenase-like predicted oxidoreductase
METVLLGRTDLRVSRIGFGCAAIGGYDYGAVDDHASIRAVRKALDHGITLFDTADVYGFGHAEEVLGRALGDRRRDVVVATKFGVRWDTLGRRVRDIRPEWARMALENSLRRLRLECIPLYQIHGPDGVTPIGEILAVLETFRKEGKIRHIGCCNYRLDALKRTPERVRVESFQVPYSLAEREWEAEIRYARDHLNMSILAYNALAQGLLTGKYDRHSQFSGTDLRQRSRLFQGETFAKNLRILDHVRAVASRRRCSPAQVAIRWILETQPNSVVLAGMKHETQVEENCSTLNWHLTPDDLNRLSSTLWVDEGLKRSVS